jgi:hypothetical protein
MKSTPCAECEAITLEYRRACLDFWLNASDETRDACRAIGQLLAGGSEADAAQDLLHPFKPETSESKMNGRFLEAYVGNGVDQVRGEFVGKGSSRIAGLMSRKLQHQFKSGHHVSLRPYPPRDHSKI